MSREAGKTWLVLSDPHSNSLALEAVLRDARSRAPFAGVVCAGDLVGYGWDPNGVVRTIREIGARSVLGNHEWALTSEDEFVLNEDGVQAALRNLEELTEESYAFLASLSNEPLALEGSPIALVHGSFDFGEARPEEPYVYTEEKAAAAMCALLIRSRKEPALRRARIGIVGHTHIQTCWIGRVAPEPRWETTTFWRSWSTSDGPGGEAPVLELALDEDAGDGEPVPAMLLNPGSVGQPRDRDPRAAYCLLHISESVAAVEFRRVEYDVELARERMRELGYPPFLIQRLREGR
jgi:diadenosine tetraphosphatase ApaH/serine/threonine PP2A family protein phosphatase